MLICATTLYLRRAHMNGQGGRPVRKRCLILLGCPERSYSIVWTGYEDPVRTFVGHRQNWSQIWIGFELFLLLYSLERADRTGIDVPSRGYLLASLTRSAAFFRSAKNTDSFLSTTTCLVTRVRPPTMKDSFRAKSVTLQGQYLAYVFKKSVCLLGLLRKRTR